MPSVLAVYGIENTSAEFQRGVLDMSERIGGNPDYWLAVMSFETGGTFDPAIRNPLSQAVGLIQFTKGTADILGTTRDALAQLSAVEQLVWVERYLRPATGKFDRLADHYMAVFAPIGMGKPDDFVLYRAYAPTAQARRRYIMNAPLDASGDGTITVGEATAPVAKIVDNATYRIEVPVGSAGPSATEIGGTVGGLLGLLLFILGIRKFKQLGRTKT